MAAITVTEGTQTDIVTETAGGAEVGVVKLDMSAAGTYGVSMFRGTIAQVNNLGTLANLASGTLGAVQFLPGNLGGDANAAAQTGNPAAIGGTDSGGTLRTILVDTKGQLALGAGTLTTVSNLTNGSVKVTTGTINAGTINTGTINAGTINLGTIVGKDANAAAQSGNPLAFAGTDGGGTVYTFKTDTKGFMYLGGGTVNTLDSITNLAKGTITKVEGGTVGEVTTVANITNGSVRITVGTITVLPNLPQGSINVTAGTVTAGTVNVATVTAGTINTGTINAGTINTGTFRQDFRPTAAVNSFGTMSAATIGTLVAAPSAGSSIFINSLSILAITGTAEALVSFGLVANNNGLINRGNFVAGGGAVQSFPIPNSANITGSALTWNIVGGSGSVAYNVSYFIAVP